jgi:ribulose-5-phosphate 4-epimerase/fuculose-1-phosphate aldolase
MTEAALRDDIALLGRSLFERGYSCGSAGNISVRLDDGGMLMTPTNSCLGRLDPARIARLDADGALVAGDKPSKEVFMHQAMYDSRPDARAVVHLHSTYAVAVGLDPDDLIPPLTPYFVMRVGKLPQVPYFRPGDPAMGPAIAEKARGNHAVMLANHGPVVAGKSLADAVYASEELEEAARLYMMLRGSGPRLLDAGQVADLRRVFG